MTTWTTGAASDGSEGGSSAAGTACCRQIWQWIAARLVELSSAREGASALDAQSSKPDSDLPAGVAASSAVASRAFRTKA